MLRRKWFVVSASLLLGFVLGGVAIHWWFNGNTRPFSASNVLHSVHGETGEATCANGIVFAAPPDVRLHSRTDSNEALNTNFQDLGARDMRRKGLHESLSLLLSSRNSPGPPGLPAAAAAERLSRPCGPSRQRRFFASLPGRPGTAKTRSGNATTNAADPAAMGDAWPCSTPAETTSSPHPLLRPA